MICPRYRLSSSLRPDFSVTCSGGPRIKAATRRGATPWVVGEKAPGPKGGAPPRRHDEPPLVVLEANRLRELPRDMGNAQAVLEPRMVCAGERQERQGGLADGGAAPA